MNFLSGYFFEIEEESDKKPAKGKVLVFLLFDRKSHPLGDLKYLSLRCMFIL